MEHENKLDEQTMKNTNFDFLKFSPSITTLSLSLSLLALIWVIVNGLHYGIDFAGGNEIQVRFQQAPSVSDLRKYVSEKGFAHPAVQTFGDAKKEFLIFMPAVTQPKEKDSSAGSFSDTDRDILPQLIESFKRDFAEQGVEIRKVDSVGPQIGSELRTKGILALFYSLILILIYLSIRFDYKFAPAAVICLFHDAILTIWVFALFDLTVSVQTLSALLAIIGYSLNDTIVTFDRIRENREYLGKTQAFSRICNRSINDVLSRTLLTSLTTMMAVGVMWFYTDGVIRDFAFTLGVGVLIGTYSSIYVATPLLVFINHLQQKKKQL